MHTVFFTAGPLYGVDSYIWSIMDNLVRVSFQIKKNLYETLRNVSYETRVTQREIVELALKYYFEHGEPKDKE